MTFITGENKVVCIGAIGNKGGKNALEMILRESGRFVIRDVGEFIALSEKKTRTITIGGTIGASSSAEHFMEYDESPQATSTIFESSDMFPQDMLNAYQVEQVDIYGIALLLNLSLGTIPPDAVPVLKGAHINLWISRQPMTSWNNEDCIGVIISAYQTLPERGMSELTEGVLTTTTKKKLIPLFVPIKSSFEVEKLKEMIYVYTDISILGYCPASTVGGTIAGSGILDCKLIIGRGFLPEEVEELLSPSQ